MKTKRFLATLIMVVAIPVLLLASPAKDIKNAAEDGKVAFLVVTDNSIKTDLSDCKKTIKAASKQTRNAVMIEINRSDDENTEILKQYRLTSIPIPMILALNPNGVISGAIQPSRATLESLVALVPSPKKAEVMKALSGGNAVFITASHKGMTTLGTVSDSCAIACQKGQGKAVCIKIDMNDEDESAFIKELKIDTSSAEPVTIVANPKGQIAAQFTGPVKVDDLVQATTKTIGGCCPPKVTGGTQACPPAKK